MKKLRYEKDIRGALVVMASFGNENFISSELVKDNPETIASTLTSLYSIIHMLCEDCETLEAEIRRLKEIYEGDDLK